MGQDGEMLEAIDDATHSTTTDTYQLYSRDTKRKYEIWKEDTNSVSGVNNVVGRWRKKMVKGNKSARPVSLQVLSYLYTTLYAIMLYMCFVLKRMIRIFGILCIFSTKVWSSSFGRRIDN